MYIDASIFLFAALKQKHLEESKDFLKRIHKKEMNGFVSIVVLDEVLFKLIQAETSIKFSIPISSVVQFLKMNPDKIQELTKCWDAMDKILSLNINILDAPRDFQLVMSCCKEHKLLTRDALHVAVMRTHRLAHIATGDADFKRVSGLTVWMPS